MQIINFYHQKITKKKKKNRRGSEHAYEKLVLNLPSLT